MRYLPLTHDDRRAMLDVIGVASVDELFVDVPAVARREGFVDLPTFSGEIEVERELAALSAKNRAAGQGPFFCGAGAYRHHVPCVIPYSLCFSRL